MEKYINPTKESMKNTILHIDDIKVNLELFEDVFESDYIVLSASNTKEAEVYLNKNDIKVIVTDQKMADETGIEFINRIKPEYPDLLFIVLTAYSEVNIVRDALNSGVYKFIQKPWEPEETKLAIENAIKKYDTQKQNKELLFELKEKNKELKITNEQLLILARQFRQRNKDSKDSEKLFNTIFNYLPLVVYLVNSDRQIIKLNKTGQVFANKLNSETVGLRGGDVFNCINSFNKDGGCGASDECKSCIINNTVINSFKYETDYHKIDATLTINRNGKPDELKIVLSTTYLDGTEPMVLVSYDDISDNKEIIALKSTE